MFTNDDRDNCTKRSSWSRQARNPSNKRLTNEIIYAKKRKQQKPEEEKQKRIKTQRDSTEGGGGRGTGGGERRGAHYVTVAVNKKRARATATYFVRHQGETVLGFYDLANKLLLPRCWKLQNNGNRRTKPPLLTKLDAYYHTSPHYTTSYFHTTRFFFFNFKWLH